MCAAMGNLPALKHLVEKYSPNIDCANKAKSETPLFSACRGGHLDCAMYLLSLGAASDGSEWAEETPIYWLCAFSDNDIPQISRQLVEAGANLRNWKHRRGHRKRQRGVWVDSEDMFLLPVSPLSRAVMMRSIPAVMALLALGADPLEDISSLSSICPIVLAAVLTLPDILEILLQHLDDISPEPVRVFSDMEMLHIALNLTATAVDVTSLQSRVVRHGMDYKVAMHDTLKLLHSRDTSFSAAVDASESRQRAHNTVMALLVALGRVDIVESLLQLGHSVHGTPAACPVVQAVRLNHTSLFLLLVENGADINMEVMGANGWKFSLLQSTARRPPQSRPGIGIPKYLLEAGIPVDPQPGNSPPAFAAAVNFQDFDLADLLLQNGADIDFSYNMNDGQPGISIFGDLFQNPAGKYIDSIKYLLQIDRRSNPLSDLSSWEGSEIDRNSLSSSTSSFALKLPNPIVSNKNGDLSIFHYAADYTPRSDQQAVILNQMIRHVLSVEKYSRPEVIDFVHPEWGTALGVATSVGNLDVVSALLDHGADLHQPFRSIPLITLATSMIGAPDLWPWPKDFPGRDDKTVRQKASKRYQLISDLLREKGARDSTTTERSG